MAIAGHAELPQERSHRINAACPREVERAHAVLVPVKADQVFRRFTNVLATFNVKHARRSLFRWLLRLGGHGGRMLLRECLPAPGSRS
jgi:hypothetical protein